MRSIRSGIQLPLLIGVPLFTLLMGMLAAVLVTDRLHSDFDAALRAKAQTLASLTQFNGLTRQIEFNFSDELMPEFSRRGRPEYFELRDASGRLLERSHSLHSGALPTAPLAGGEPTLRNYRTEDGRAGRVFQLAFVPDQPDAQRQRIAAPQALLLLAVGTDQLDALVLRVYLINLATTVLLVFAISALIHRVLGRGLQPLADVAAQLADVRVGSPGARLDVMPAASELAPVVNRVNAMLALLDEAIARERQFSSDVAHELRTPVAELKSLAEVGARWHADAAMAARFYADALSIAQQMERIVEQLLALAQTDACAIRKTLVPVDAVALVHSAWASVAVVAAERDIQLNVQSRGQGALLSDADALHMLLRNLLDNAVHYSPPRTEVEVTVQRDAVHGWKISVSNAAPDLQQSDIAHLFERFWRKDPARSDGAHAGLGLALVHSLARVVGLNARAALSADGQLSIALTATRPEDRPAVGAGV